MLFSISGVCGHRSAKLVGGIEANFWRLLVAGVLLGLWSFTFGIGLGGPALGLFLLSGCLGIGIGDVALFEAYPRLGSRLSLLLIDCFTAPLAALLEWLWLGTTLSGPQVIAMLVILGGVAAALAPSEHVHRPKREILVGVSLCLVSGLAGAVGVVLSRNAYALMHTTGAHLSGGNAAFQRVVGGAVVSAVFLLYVSKRSRIGPPRGGSYRHAWHWLLLNGLAGQTLGVSCMQWALETTPGGIVMAIISLTPITIIPLAARMEGERLSARALVASLVAVAGVIALVLV